MEGNITSTVFQYYLSTGQMDTDISSGSYESLHLLYVSRWRTDESKMDSRPEQIDDIEFWLYLHYTANQRIDIAELCLCVLSYY